MNLEDNVREFLKILDTVEESDSGKIFHPVFISCSRAMTRERLDGILKEMMDQVGFTPKKYD